MKVRIMAKKQDKQNANENLPMLAPPRLAYHPAVKERFGIDKSDWKALTEAIFPNAQTPESVILALSYCKARKLDPFKRCVHIVPIWDKAKKRYVDTVWPGIGELRTTAHRTKQYAGTEKCEFGPDKTQLWEGRDEKYGDYRHEVTFPEWAQVTVYRMIGNVKVSFPGPKVWWIETFGEDRNGSPNSMWRKRPRGQIDKCGEAAALRVAFPEEVGNDYIDTEAHLTKQVDSREVEVEPGNAGLKKLLTEKEKNRCTTDEPPPEPEAETAQNEETETPPDNAAERDDETEARVQAEKDKLQTTGSAKKSNLF